MGIPGNAGGKGINAGKFAGAAPEESLCIHDPSFCGLPPGKIKKFCSHLPAGGENSPAGVSYIGASPGKN